MADSRVEFFEDDEDILYVDLEGKMEVRFSLSDTEEYVESFRGKTQEERAEGLAALVLDFALALAEESVPAIRRAAQEHFEVRFDDAEAEAIEDRVFELLPGFMHSVDEEEMIEE